MGASSPGGGGGGKQQHSSQAQSPVNVIQCHSLSSLTVTIWDSLKTPGGGTNDHHILLLLPWGVIHRGMSQTYAPQPGGQKKKLDSSPDVWIIVLAEPPVGEGLVAFWQQMGRVQLLSQSESP